MEANKRDTSLKEGSTQFLPGIPDEITLGLIVPKLSWKVFHILSSVSRAWLHGIRTHQVYDARVRSHSTETLAIVRFLGGDSPDGTTGVLCSTRKEPMLKRGDLPIYPTGTKLPPIPGNGGQWLCSDGYIYYLIGPTNSFKDQGWNDKVFVFDVVGGRQWKECSSMNEPGRYLYGYGVMYGKLYVLGGVRFRSRHNINAPFRRSSFCGSEVYDPKGDCWSPITPMTTFRFGHKVETVGDELFVHGGLFFSHDHFNARKTKDDADSSDEKVNPWLDVKGLKRGEKVLEVYHPVNDEWRTVNPFGRYSNDYLFAAGGKLYSFDWSSIHVYVGENSWTHLHSFSFPILSLPEYYYGGETLTAVVVDGEVLVNAYWGIGIGGRICRSGFRRRGSVAKEKRSCGRNLINLKYAMLLIRRVHTLVQTIFFSFDRD